MTGEDVVGIGEFRRSHDSESWKEEGGKKAHEEKEVKSSQADF